MEARRSVEKPDWHWQLDCLSSPTRVFAAFKFFQ